MIIRVARAVVQTTWMARSAAVTQIAGNNAPSMLGVVFQNLCLSDGFKQIIKRDILLNHLLLSMLRDAQVSGTYLDTHSIQNMSPSIAAHVCPVKWIRMAGPRSAGAWAMQ